MRIDFQDTYQSNSDRAENAKKDSVPYGQRRAADVFDGVLSPVSMMMLHRMNIGGRHVIVRRIASVLRCAEKIPSQWMVEIFHMFLHFEIDESQKLPTGECSSGTRPDKVGILEWVSTGNPVAKLAQLLYLAFQRKQEQICGKWYGSRFDAS